MPVSGHRDLEDHVAFSSVLQVCSLGSGSYTCSLDVNLAVHKQLSRVTFPSSSLRYLGIFQFPRAPSFCPLAQDWGFIYLSPLPISHHCTHIWGQVWEEKENNATGVLIHLLGTTALSPGGEGFPQSFKHLQPLTATIIARRTSCSLGLNKKACPGALSACSLMALPQVQTGRKEVVNLPPVHCYFRLWSSPLSL